MISKLISLHGPLVAAHELKIVSDDPRQHIKLV